MKEKGEACVPVATLPLNDPSEVSSARISVESTAWRVLVVVPLDIVYSTIVLTRPTNVSSSSYARQLSGLFCGGTLIGVQCVCKDTSSSNGGGHTEGEGFTQPRPHPSLGSCLVPTDADISYVSSKHDRM